MTKIFLHKFTKIQIDFSQKYRIIQMLIIIATIILIIRIANNDDDSNEIAKSNSSNFSHVNRSIKSKRSIDYSCNILSVADLLKYAEENQYRNGVPKIVHYIYKHSFIPVQYFPLIKRCMKINFDVKFVFWTDSLITALIVKYFPEMLSTYETYLKTGVEPLKLSDTQRYFILWKFGGVYMDFDTDCLRPLEVVMSNESCILSQENREQSRILHQREYLAMNSWMACIAEHNFFRFLIQKIKKADNSSILAQSGPYWLTDLFREYSNSSHLTRLEKDVVGLAESHVFSPLTYFESLKMRCSSNKTDNKWFHQGCRDLASYAKNEDSEAKDAVVIHLFLHLGYEENYKRIFKRKNMCIVSDKIYQVHT